MTNLQQQLKQAEEAEAHFDALTILEQLVAAYPDKPEFRYQLALKHIKTGDPGKAEELFLECAEAGLAEPMLDINLGHALKALGRSREAAKAYKRVAAGFDDVSASIAYWSLADLKDYRFGGQETVLIQGRAQVTEAKPGYRALMLFALGAAREQQGRYEDAFMALSEANLIVSEHRPFKADQFFKLVQSLVSEVKTAAPPVDYQGPTPVFVIGLPRSGTTLVEQVLASHSEVESTDELPYLERLGLGLEEAGGYGWALERFTPEQQSNFAARYLESVVPYRRENKPFFIDKNPTNFLHIGLIKAIFPQAKIINVVRDTLDNTMGVYKQYFNRGNEFSYSIQGIIYYWQGYLTLMRHWEQLYPGEMLHLSYESITRNPDQKIAEILEYCGLPREEACFRFYESDRPVLTPSATQVRSPITGKSVGSGLNYQEFIRPHIPALAEITRKAKEILKI
ncbi:MAG: sulfotransferase [Xanthomonadales bacterium]|jgi:tetratricopeptide (TPR) repeat protein|nr:sulfotransferase [Xanthomonadales bacterium]